MGCCQSSSRSLEPASPSRTHISNSAHNSTSSPPPHLLPTLPPNRPLALSEHFNAPLRPHVWRSGASNRNGTKRRWTRSALAKERAEFFDTRVTGREEIWGSLRVASEMLRRGETVDAQALLDAAGATVPTGDIVQGVYDEAGAYYQIPNWIAADPEGLIQDEEGEAEPKKDEEVEETEPNSEKGKEKDDGGSDTVRVKARLSDRAQDVVIRTGRSERVGVLSKKVAEEAGVDNGKVRIAYMGKVLRNNESLNAQGWREGHVVNALVFQ